MKITTTLTLICLTLSAAGAARAATPAENWENNCASCHGEDGKGQTKQGKKLKLRDYTDPKVQAEFKDEDMLKAILEGITEKGKERMKAYKDELTEEEAKELVVFTRKLKV